MSPWKANKIPDNVESPSSDGVPNPQTDRQPCISPLALKAKQKHAYRIRTCREERWELIELSDSIKTMGNGNQNASLHAWKCQKLHFFLTQFYCDFENFTQCILITFTPPAPPITLNLLCSQFWVPSPSPPSTEFVPWCPTTFGSGSCPRVWSTHQDSCLLRTWTLSSSCPWAFGVLRVLSQSV